MRRRGRTNRVPKHRHSPPTLTSRVLGGRRLFCPKRFLNHFSETGPSQPPSYLHRSDLCLKRDSNTRSNQAPRLTHSGHTVEKRNSSVIERHRNKHPKFTIFVIRPDAPCSPSSSQYEQLNISRLTQRNFGWRKRRLLWLPRTCQGDCVLGCSAVYRRFRGACWHHHRGDSPEDWGGKRLWTVGKHGATSQKT